MGDLVPDREGFLAVGGNRVRWEYVGKGDREAVCLLNGLAMHTRAWFGVLPRLLDRYKDQAHALVRLTLAQDPFLAALDGNLAGYAAFPGPGHVVYLEKPEAFFGVLRRFLEAKSTRFDA